MGLFTWGNTLRERPQICRCDNYIDWIKYCNNMQILHRHELHDKDGLYHRRLVSAEDDN